MKKLISLLIITLLCVSAFGQIERLTIDFQIFDKNPAYELVVADKLPRVLELEKTYTFIADGKQFLISYDNEIITSGDSTIRYIYLYRLDADGWNRACDVPIDFDYVYRPNNELLRIEVYNPYLHIGSFGLINVGSTNGIVMIHLHKQYVPNQFMKNEKYGWKTENKRVKFFLVSNNDGTYNLIK